MELAVAASLLRPIERRQPLTLLTLVDLGLDLLPLLVSGFLLLRRHRLGRAPLRPCMPRQQPLERVPNVLKGNERKLLARLVLLVERRLEE